MKKYYIEKDGRIFLIKKNGKYSLPTNQEILNFELIIKHKSKDGIIFCEPILDLVSDDWVLKDNALLMEDISLEIKKCIVKSYIRPAVLGIIRRENKILMVKSSEGFTKNFWNLPGGFLSFGETPEEALIREIMEETNLKVKVIGYPKLYTYFFEQFPMLGIVYKCKIIGGKLEPKNEIREIDYKTIEFGIKNTKNFFVKAALSELK
ncbi:MAG: NUDIX hydrolase [Candidatus Aenigmatarchaeota archaeon]